MNEPYMVKTLPTSQREQVAKMVNLQLYSLRESETYLSDYVAMRVTATKVHGVIVQTATECAGRDRKHSQSERMY